MLRPLADWIAATPLSKALSDQPWVVPTSQSIHILAVAAVFASALMINLRLLGVGAKGRSVSQLSDTLIPWMWRGLVVLLVTGSIQTLAEPVRQFVTPAFWAKMALIIIVSVMTILFVRALRRNAPFWDDGSSRPLPAKIFAVVSTLMWVAIIICGRFIAYTCASFA
jgi:hypothetical protein